MRVLVACEFSATVRDAFRARGHDAYSCDMLETEGDPEYHIRGDAIQAAYNHNWDLMIAHPPCTYLTSAGLFRNKDNPRREEQTEQALYFVQRLMNAPIPRICIENPVGRIGTAIRPADQYIQPYGFGEDASKKTGLWLKNLPFLKRTEYYHPRFTADGTPRWGNQTDSGQNKLPPSKDRWKIRSKTYQGIADAMAEQWGYDD